MQELGLMERFADPVLFEGLTSGEKTIGGFITTLMGMGTTFVVLILLWGIIAFTSGLIRKADGKAAAKAAAKAAGIGANGGGTAAAAAMPAAGTATAQSQAKDASLELIAVITAAITAIEGAGAMSKLRISKIRRISGDRTAWNQAGSADCIESRKI
ncbi:hypothetical protein MASR2M70_08200 [Bacillota bacterium]